MPSSLLLEGAPGTGKTYSLRTVLEVPNVELFLIETDPGGEETMLESLTPEQRNRVHVARVFPSKMEFSELLQIAKIIHTKTYEQLTQEKAGISTSKFNHFFNVLSTAHNFKDSDTGKEYGPLNGLPRNTVVALDGISGVGDMVMSMMVGARAIMAQGEYAVCQKQMYDFLFACCNHTPGLFVAIAHIEREPNEVTGQSMITTSTIGQKLGPKLPRMFRDVVLAERGITPDGKPNFTWSTMKLGVDLKVSRVPLGPNLPASFVPLITKLKLTETNGVKAAS